MHMCSKKQAQDYLELCYSYQSDEQTPFILKWINFRVLTVE